jgi:hypothetical protein
MVFSQQTILKKSTIDFSLRVKPLNHTFRLPVVFHTTAIESHFTNFQFDYKYAIGRKYSLGVIYNYELFKMRNQNYIIVSRGDYEDNYDFKSKAFNSNLGLSFNLYFKGWIAPIGNSISFYYKRNNSIMTGILYHNQIDKTTRNVIEENEDFKRIEINTNVLGVSFNGMKFLSNKMPMYISYSIGGGLTIGTNLKLDGEKYEFPFFEDDYSRFDETMDAYKKNILYGEWFSFNVGLGFYL